MRHRREIAIFATENHRLMKRIFIGLILTCTALAAAAQPHDETKALAARIDSLTTEVGTLRTESTAWEKIRARLPRISGYIQTGYEWADDASGFHIKRVRVDMKGDILREKLDYRLQVEFASPKIVDAYVQWHPFAQLHVKLGQYKIPFSIENTDYPPLKFEVIEYPLALQRMMGFSEKIGDKSLSATGRELGATLYGGFFRHDGYDVLSYDISLFNGAGINTKDNNRSKDVAARLTVRPFGGMKLSGSYYRGEFGAEYLLRERYGAGACYDRGAVVVRGEWIGGRTGTPAADGAPSGSFRSSGWYALGGWRFSPKWMVVARYDTLLADTRTASSRQTDYTAGLTWMPLKWLRGQLNYTYEDYKISATQNRNVASLMVTAMF